jgi:hypothetical protein
VYTDVILNLVWAAVCLAAFAWLIAFERRRRHASWRAITNRAMALTLALVSLFPCVSASDDWVRLQFLGASASSPAPGVPHQAPASGDQPDKKALGMLVRMLEALDSVQVSVALALSIVLCLFALALIETHQSLDRFLPARAGRAPPVTNPRLIPV